MNKRILCSALVSAVIAQSAFATEALNAGKSEVKFTGSIVNGTCQISNDSKSKEVYLGKWPTIALSAAGKTTAPQTFSLNLENCPDANYTVRLEGTAIDEDAYSNLLAVTGGAKNVGIQVTGLDGKVLPLNQELNDGFTFKGKGAKTTVNLQAFYKATGVATEGQANATANFSVEYK
jgi:major type 1 subunit fimbrin (pilin)